MKQKDIVIPISCHALFLILWTVGTIGGIIHSYFHFTFNRNEEGHTVAIFIITAVSTIFLTSLSVVKLTQWLRAKPRLPFRFRCRCDV